MKVGIITFHWATNYGAVLQAYALQEAVKSLGHEVEIINYKPRLYNDNLWTFIRFRKFLNFNKYKIDRSKEQLMESFRKLCLTSRTERYSSLSQLQKNVHDYDVLITGSDQVLNPSFLQSGEWGGSTAYFLNFGGEKVRRLSYAASFGTTDYPELLIKKVKPLIERFHAVSARENSGIEIFKAMGAKNPTVVCDPTLLQNADFYDNIIDKEKSFPIKKRGYFLRNREKKIADVLTRLDVSIFKDEFITDWIASIKKSSHFITNSFHGVVFCLLYHVPFTVVLETLENVEMNDRFYSLLTPLGLTHRMVLESGFSEKDIDFDEDWEQIDRKLESYRRIGWNFLKNNIN
ncbi:MAG: polysaccharide pyruvyl transferase family protein [Muribaculaceae bacterium]|nr:polysaccharide pyruvyl transferase family protein [Muribaculaceae bacterium]